MHGISTAAHISTASLTRYQSTDTFVRPWAKEGRRSVRGGGEGGKVRGRRGGGERGTGGERGVYEEEREGLKGRADQGEARLQSVHAVLSR
eukprot:1371329-Rhodomonas_salina.1